MDFLIKALEESFHLLLDSSVYVLFGLVMAGLLRVFLQPSAVARHFGSGRFSSVFKAALLGIPIPLCSCGVLPAAVSLKKQGANNGAVTAFLISTPESGVDSIAVSWALLDPIMTAARPLAAFFTALCAGLLENSFGQKKDPFPRPPDLSCPIDGCCSGLDCPPQEHARHHGLGEKILAGLKFAVKDVWADMAGWFLVGLVLAGLITALVPAEAIGKFLGGGFLSMLIMLAIGAPLYICATASTPIAAALILKGVSPGAALVFLLAGPATNITSLTVLFGSLGRRAAVIYLASIGVCSVLFGLAVDQVYFILGLSARAAVGQAAEILPEGMKWAGAVILLLMSIGPVKASLAKRFGKAGGGSGGCSGGDHCSCSTPR
ncbi:MAG: SO_0444 family Cu/Zn efflux transporter [Pseudomonadota bacterium]